MKTRHPRILGPSDGAIAGRKRGKQYVAGIFYHSERRWRLEGRRTCKNDRKDRVLLASVVLGCGVGLPISVTRYLGRRPMACCLQKWQIFANMGKRTLRERSAGSLDGLRQGYFGQFHRFSRCRPTGSPRSRLHRRAHVSIFAKICRIAQARAPGGGTSSRARWEHRENRVPSEIFSPTNVREKTRQRMIYRLNNKRDPRWACMEGDAWLLP